MNDEDMVLDPKILLGPGLTDDEEAQAMEIFSSGVGLSINQARCVSVLLGMFGAQSRQFAVLVGIVRAAGPDLTPMRLDSEEFHEIARRATDDWLVDAEPAGVA